MGIIKVRLFKDLYGTDLNGLQVTIAQVITFINICELAYSLAFRQLLYKPLAENDREGVLRIYHSAVKIFRLTGAIVLAVSFIISALFPFFAASPLNYIETTGTFLILSLPYAVSYFLMGPNFVIMADQKEYKITIWIQSIAILRMLFMILAIKLHMPFVTIILIEGCNIIVANYGARRIALKAYPWLKQECKETDDSFSKKSKYAIIQRLSELATTQTDNIVITAFMGYSFSGVFGSYSYLTDSISKITQAMVTSPMNSFGNLFSERRANAYRVFNEFYHFSAFISTIVAAVIFIVMPQFVHIWMNDPLYEVPLLICAAFSLNIFYMTMRQPIIICRDANGLYVNAKNNAYLLAAMKILLSIILIQKFQLLGVILATLITNWTVDFFYNPVLVYRNVFQISPWRYYAMTFVRLTIMILIAMSGYFIWEIYLPWIQISSLRFVLAVLISGVSISFITFIIYSLLFSPFRALLYRIITILKGKRA